MRAVNLLPADRLRVRRQRVPARVSRFQRLDTRPLVALAAAAAVLLVALPLAAAYTRASGKAEDRRETLTELERELAQVKREQARRRAPLASSAPRLAALATASSTRIAWDRLLRDLSRVVPHDVWLSGLTARTPTAAAAAAGGTSGGSTPVTGTVATGFLLTGRTFSQASVARTLTRLALVPELTNVQLQKSELIKVDDRRVFEFTVGADIRSSGGA